MNKTYKDYQRKELNLKSHKTTVFKHVNKHPENCSFDELPQYISKFKTDQLLLELFCGAGGLSLGLMQSGFRPTLSVDKNSKALDTHSAYFPGASVNDDLSEYEVIDYLTEPFLNNEISLLAGGPPCQPFSKASRYIRSTDSKGMGSLLDNRRDLWEYFLYAAERVRPLTILIENVTDIASNEDGIVLRQIISRMEEMGYEVDSMSFYAYDLEYLKFVKEFYFWNKIQFENFKWPDVLEESERPTLRDAISDLPFVEPGWDKKLINTKGL